MADNAVRVEIAAIGEVEESPYDIYYRRFIKSCVITVLVVMIIHAATGGYFLYRNRDLEEIYRFHWNSVCIMVIITIILIFNTITRWYIFGYCDKYLYRGLQSWLFLLMLAAVVGSKMATIENEDLSTKASDELWIFYYSTLFLSIIYGCCFLFYLLVKLMNYCERHI
jgi:hypothetical protein